MDLERVELCLLNDTAAFSVMPRVGTRISNWPLTGSTPAGSI